MPSSVRDVFAAAGLTPAGVVRRGQRLPEAGPGVYAVSLTERADAVDDVQAQCPLSGAAIDELLAARPSFASTAPGQPPKSSRRG